MTGRLGLAARMGALVLAVALGLVTGLVWMSPRSDPGDQTTTTQAEAELAQENADLRAILEDRDAQIEDIESWQEKAARERAEGAESGAEKAAAERAAAQEAGRKKAAAERAAAAQLGRDRAAAERAAAAERGRQKAALERAAADALGRAEGAAIREQLVRAQAAAAQERAAQEAAARQARLEQAWADEQRAKEAAAEAEAQADALRPKPTPAPTAPPLRELLAPDLRYFGLYTAQSPFSWAEYDDVTSKVGVQPSVAGYFQGWDGDFRADAVTRSWAKGKLPLMTWESRPLTAANDQRTDPEYSLPRILDGDFDEYLHQYARDVADLGLPLAIRLNHEMNGDWYPWSEVSYTGGTVNGNRRGDYVKTWRHVHDIFEEEGANAYVIWVWAPNIVNSLGEQSRSLEYTRSLYPGDEYVDWVGLSGYYRPPYRADQTPTFSYTYDRSLDQLRAITDKPVLLAEIGASEVGGQKAAWVEDLFESLAEPANSDVLGFVWFNHAVTTNVRGELVTNDWRITSRRSSLEAFKEGIANPAAGFVAGTVMATLAAPSSAPTAEATVGPTPVPTPAGPTPTATPQAAPTPTPTPTGPDPDPSPSSVPTVEPTTEPEDVATTAATPEPTTTAAP